MKGNKKIQIEKKKNKIISDCVGRKSCRMYKKKKKKPCLGLISEFSEDAEYKIKI